MSCAIVVSIRNMESKSKCVSYFVGVEVKVVVVDHQQRGVVVAVVDRTAALNLYGAFKIGLGGRFVDGDLHGTGHAFCQKEFIGGPSAAIHKLGDGGFQLLEDGDFDVVYRGGDDADLAV